MNLGSDIKQNSIDTLLKYNELAKDLRNHPDMIKDKTVLNFLTYVLDTDDGEILKLALETIELFCKNADNRPFIKEAFGMIESLQILADNKALNNDLRERAEALMQVINTPRNNLYNKENEKISTLNKTFIFHVHGLHEDTKKDLEEVLSKKVKGVHSVVVDVEHQRCIAMTYDNLDPKLIAAALSQCTGMEARLVSKNKFNQEILVSLTEDSPQLDLEDLPPYLDEKDSPVKEKAVRSMKDIRITASEWFTVAAGILQKSFYW